MFNIAGFNVHFQSRFVCMLGLIRTVVFIASACIAGPAIATPLLLVEFTHKVNTIEAPSPPPGTVPFDFDASNSVTSVDFLSWEQNLGPSDSGITFVAPESVIAMANPAFFFPRTSYHLNTGPANSLTVSSLNNPFCNPDACVSVTVPNLSQYKVTSMERVIDELQLIDTQSRFYNLRATQRIRILGEQIPEPATLLLVLVVSGMLMASRQVDTFEFH
jgi:hypothetical protein